MEAELSTNTGNFGFSIEYVSVLNFGLISNTKSENNVIKRNTPKVQRNDLEYLFL